MKSKVKRLLIFAMALIMVIGVFPATYASAATLYWPVPGHTRLSQGFHNGNAIDISDGSISGATVVAAMGGTVTHIFLCGTQHYGNSSANCCYGFGTGLVIKGDDGRIYQYAHMQANSIPSNVYRTAYVKAGQTIGRVGTTGNSTGYHLHFGISYGNYWNASGINPQNESYIYSTPSQSLFTSVWVENVTETNATVYATMPLTYVQNAGCYIGTSQSNMDIRLMDNTYSNVSKMWFNMNEYKVTLKPGTVYYYRLFVIINGVEYKSEIKQFTTAGTAHQHYYNQNIVTPPASTEKGYTTHKCSCGHSYVDTYTNPLGIVVSNSSKQNFKVSQNKSNLYTVNNLSVSNVITATGGKTQVTYSDGKTVSGNTKLQNGMIITLKNSGGSVIDKKTIIVLGDVNGDSEITASDARMALRVSVSLEKINNWAMLAADFNGDTAIAASDARLILRTSVGLENTSQWIATLK